MGRQEIFVLKRRVKGFCLGLQGLGSLGWGRIEHKIGNSFDIIKSMTLLSNSTFVAQAGLQVFSTNSVLYILWNQRKELCWINWVSILVFLSASPSNLTMDADSILLNGISSLSWPSGLSALHPWSSPWALVATAHQGHPLCCRTLTEASWMTKLCPCLCSWPPQPGSLFFLLQVWLLFHSSQNPLIERLSQAYRLLNVDSQLYSLSHFPFLVCMSYFLK